MRLNTVEFLAMNNPLRRLFQKHLEFEIFLRSLREHGITLRGKAVLDAGCGSGYSTHLIWERFSPAKLLAFDLMPEQVALARNREIPARFFVGDIGHIPFQDEAFDAAFVFGILHHVPLWQEGVAEIARVIKAGGVLLIEEPDRAIVDFADHYLGFSHPERSRFTLPEFVGALRQTGFHILADRPLLVRGFRSYLCRKDSSE